MSQSKIRTLFERLPTIFLLGLLNEPIYNVFSLHSHVVMCNFDDISVVYDARICRLLNRA